VKAVSGKNLSQRNIETLAYGYFRGNEQLRKQIEKGNLEWTLKQMNEKTGFSYTREPDLTREESDFIRDMELCQKYMIRVRKSLSHKKKGSKVFEKTVKLLIDGMSEIIEVFRKEIREYYD
jgi:hypothetical protein